MLNRRGQSLVLFVLLLPIMLGVMALVIDVGNALVEKNSMDNGIVMVMNIALDKNMKRDEVYDLLKYNLGDNSFDVFVVDNEITIKGETHVKGIFSKILGFSGFFIKSEYEGRVMDGKKVVNKKR